MDCGRLKRAICDVDDVVQYSPASKRFAPPDTLHPVQFSSFENNPLTNCTWTLSPCWPAYGIDDNEVNTPLVSEAHSDHNGDTGRHSDAMELPLAEEMQCDLTELMEDTVWEEVCFGMV